MGELLSETESLCPRCLARIPARRVTENGNIYLEKVCPEHGLSRTLIWRENTHHYYDWAKFSEPPEGPLKSITGTNRGCPYDCGLCSQHQTNSCTMVMEVTQSCNLRCPVCFASAGQIAYDEPDLKCIEAMYRTVLDTVGTPTIQISGGEPTLRDDLPEIVALGHRLGFEHILINSNGLRIASDTEYLKRLVDSGVSAIYLQFDGVTDDVYRYTRGRNLMQLKVKAIGNCAQTKMAVVLVPVLAPRVNDHQLGDMFRFAKKWIPTVKGIHFQPISYIGRYPVEPQDSDRITIPDVVEKLIEQSGGEIQEDNLVPAHCGESHCSFSSLFFLNEDGQLLPTTKRLADEFISSYGNFKKAPEESSRSFMNLHWRFVDEQSACCGPNAWSISKKAETFKPSSQSEAGSLDEVYRRVLTRGLSITCMPFQDVWSVDLERLARCCSHVVTPDRRIIPFCAYYLTSMSGERLYPHVSAKALQLKADR